MWFKKKREDNSVDDLKKKIEELQESNKTLNDRLSKLQRIVKYSESEPTYHLDSKHNTFMSFIIIEYTLYIYVEKEEYVIKLSELDNKNIDEEGCEFKIEDNFAYFNISSYWNLSGVNGKWERHEFIIDFKNGKYICSSNYDEALNTKENVEVIEQT